MRISRLLILGAIVLVFYILLAYSIPLWTVNSILYASPVTRLIDFCIGILLCRLYCSEACLHFKKSLPESECKIWTFWEILFITVVVASFFVYESISLRLRCAALFWLVIPPLLLFFAVSDRQGGWITRLLRHPVLLWFGSISLEIYLMHMLVFRIVNSMISSIGLTDAVFMAVIGLTVLFPVAWLTKRFFVDMIYVSLIKYVV